MDGILPIRIGMFTEGTERSSRNRWIGGVNTRFFKGLPQSVGGSLPLNTDNTFLGVCRKLHSFQSLDGIDYVALGSHIKFYIWDGSGLTDVTPIESSGTLGNNPFTTTLDSASVSVADTAHGRSVGDYVSFSNATAVGGITIDGEYTVTAVTDVNSYTITHSSAASSAATGGGGSVSYDYQLSIGLVDSQVGAGWGAGPWRAGGSYSDNRAWNEPEPGASGFVIDARVWSIDDWGEDIVAAPIGGTIYHFDTSAGVTSSNRLAEIANAPDTVQFILQSPELRHLIAFGAHDGSSSDPLLIRWSDSEDFNSWTPTITNEAGDFRLTVGNKIVTAGAVQKEILVLTDLAAYVMFQLDFPYIYGRRQVGSKCGGISPNCMEVVNNTAYWMSFSGFKMYDGVVRDMRCDVWSEAFGDLNILQSVKVFSGLNSDFKEIWWFIVVGGSNEINKVIVYDYDQDIWWLGDDVRTAWLDLSEISSKPIATGTDGLLHQHETGADNGTSPRTKRLVSGGIERNDGEDVIYVDSIIPDFRLLNGTVNVTLRGRKRPQDTQRTKGPYEFTSMTQKRSIRFRGRQLSLEVQSTALGDEWEMGPIGYDATANGKR